MIKNEELFLEDAWKNEFLMVYEKLIHQGEILKENIKEIEFLLKYQEKRIFKFHRSGFLGKEIAKAYSDCGDFFLPLMSHIVEQNLLSQEPIKSVPQEWSLIAVGGYGRRDIAPRSDVDLIWIYNAKKISPFLEKFISQSLKLLWDIGWRVGYATYSLEEAIEYLKKDYVILTSLLEARFISGSKSLWKSFGKLLERAGIKEKYFDYLHWRLEDLTKMHQKFGKSLYLQEPHIKYGQGGLRHYQSLCWISLVRYGDSSLKNFVEKGILDHKERKKLENAYNFLLKIRHEMHFQQKRRHDQLILPLQRDVAIALGYAHKNEVKASEAFMKDYYQSTREISLIANSLLKRLEEEEASFFGRWIERLFGHKNKTIFLEQESTSKNVEKVYDYFTLREGLIFANSDSLFELDKLNFLKAFLLQQEEGVEFSISLEDLMRKSLSLIDEKFRSSHRAAAFFLNILSHAGKVSPILRKMHDLGFLGAYLPEFGALTCLVQHEMYHSYTVDEHILVACEKIDQLVSTEEKKLQKYRSLFAALEHPEILYLSLLLHDTGKIFSGLDHVAKGVEITNEVTKRFSLKSDQSLLIKRLVKIHMELSFHARTRDLDDPLTVAEMAEIAINEKTLDLLLLLTLADGMATSDQIWNDWKDQLVWKLYSMVKEYFKKKGVSNLKAATALRYQIEEDLLKRLPLQQHALIKSHCATMPDRYFIEVSPEQVEEQIRSIEKLFYSPKKEEKDFYLFWYEEDSRPYTRLITVTRIQKDFPRSIAAGFQEANIDIFSANSFIGCHYMIDDFQLSPRGCVGKLYDHEKKKFEELLCYFSNRDLKKREQIFELLRKKEEKVKKTNKRKKALFSPQVWVDHQKHPLYTIVEIKAPERFGLFYDLITELKKSGFFVMAIRIYSEFGGALDTFFLTDLKGEKVSKEYLERIDIKERLLEAAIG